MWATSCSRLQFNLCPWRVGESDIVAHGELRRGHCDVCFLEAAANISMTEMRRIAALQYFGRKRAGSLGERGNLNGQSAPPRTFEAMMFGWLETQCASGSSLPSAIRPGAATSAHDLHHAIPFPRVGRKQILVRAVGALHQKYGFHRAPRTFECVRRD